MSAEIRYNREINGYRLQVVKSTDGAANYYTALLTDTITGATSRSDGWRSYPDALDMVRTMYERAM